MTDPERRLTSWKAIASYLGREVRTVTRWEKERGLPVHRGPDRRSGVVFADMDELDAWMRGVKLPSETAAPEAAASDAGDARDPTIRATEPRWAVPAAVAVLALALAVAALSAGLSKANDHPGSTVMTATAVIARNTDGSEKWRYEFPGEVSGPPYARLSSPIEPLGDDGTLAGVTNMTARDTRAIGSGQMLWFDPVGKIRQRFSFEDRLLIGARGYTAPWSISDFQVNENRGRRLIAVTAHHYEWWPSIVTVLNDRWQRNGSFVNAGWVEHMRWVSNDRLAIAGFSNFKDGGMVALLDANALQGQSPAASASAFDCAACGPDRPVRYIVMPRSEVNRVSAAPFNRASVHVRADTLVALTVELPEVLLPASAIYEFTKQLDLVHASYSDRYWEAHRELETRGKITHTRAQCPERDGPANIEIWEPATGWRVQSVRR